MDAPAVPYAKKFKNFIRMCKEAKDREIEVVVVAYPWVLGDTYQEVLQSLSLLAEQNLSLTIAKPQLGYPSLIELVTGQGDGQGRA